MNNNEITNVALKLGVSPDWALERCEEVLMLIEGMKPTMEALVYNYLETSIPIKFDIDYVSYTDHKKIVIGVYPEEAITMSDEDIARVVRFKVGHECQHIKSTTDDFDSTIYEVKDIWMKKADELGVKISDRFCIKQAQHLVNGLEDGRIENIMCVDYPGLVGVRNWYRLKEWCSIDANNFDEMSLMLASIHSVATRGLHLPNFDAAADKFGVKELINSTLGRIGDFVSSVSCKKAMEYCKSIAEDIAEKIVLAMSKHKVSDWDDMINNILENLDEIKRRAKEGNFGKPGEPGNQENVPIVSILTDDNNCEESEGEGETPDIIIDLRKNRPESSEKEESDNDDDKKPIVIRPEDEEEEESDKKQSSSGSSSSNEDSDDEDSEESKGGSSNDENSEGKDSKGCSSDNEDSQNSSNAEKENKNDDKKSKNSQNGNSEDKAQSKDTPENTQEGEEGTQNASDEENITESDSEAPEASQSSSEDSGNEGKPSDQMPQQSDDVKDTLSEKQIKELAEKMLDKVSEETLTEARTLTESSRINREREAELERKSTQKLSSSEIAEIEKMYDGRRFRETTSKQILNRCPKKPCPTEAKRRGDRLGTEIDNILATKSTPDRSELYSGDLDEDRLANLCMGQYDIFLEDGEPYEKDSCCFVLIDQSGSMSYGNKWQCAGTAAAEIEEAFKGRIPLKIASFTEESSILHYEIKSWDDNDTDYSYSWSFFTQYGPMSGNYDAYDITVATKELMKRTEDKKLLIVLSDGAPCCSNVMVRDAVQYARDNGIFVISLFFGDEDYINREWSTYEYMYQKYFIGTTPENIGLHLARLLETFIEED